MVVSNAKTLPKVYYGLHFYEGPAEYREPGQPPYRILVNEATLRDMDATFEGCPVYVRHREDVNLDKLQEEADGYVINSFFNPKDGKHWCKFIVVSDKGHEAIRQGWTLSNAYVPESFSPGGIWNGIEYVKQITKARFEHLAIVPDPRYQESIVLTPSQFREYNENHDLELKKLANSLKEKPTVSKIFEMFKKTPVKQEDGTVVKLMDGREVSIEELVEIANTASASAAKAAATKNASGQEKDADKKEAEHKKENEVPADEDKDKKPEKTDKETEPEAEKHGRKDEPQKDHEAPQMANMEHHVPGHGGKGTMSVGQMHNEYGAMRKHFQDFSHFVKSYSNDEQMDGGEKDAKAAQDADETKTNADLDGGEKEGKAQEKEAYKTTRNAKFYEELKDAPDNAREEVAPANLEGTSRGKSRYGSGN